MCKVSSPVRKRQALEALLVLCRGLQVATQKHTQPLHDLEGQALEEHQRGAPTLEESGSAKRSRRGTSP